MLVRGHRESHSAEWAELRGLLAVRLYRARYRGGKTKSIQLQSPDQTGARDFAFVSLALKKDNSDR